MTTEIVNWLLNSDPWTAYRTRIDLLTQPASSPPVKEAFQKMISHPKILSLIEEVKEWPGKVLNSHKSAGQLYHKLAFVADLGMDRSVPGIQEIIDKVFEHRSEEGVFQLLTNIPVHFGGSGQDQFAWALCDAPINVYSLARLGLRDHPEVIRAKNHLLQLGRNVGYPCTVSKELGRFRGPGKKEDPCPYATMIMLKMMSLYAGDKDSLYAEKSVESLLSLWEQSETRHPYMFFMGTDFRKLKAPLVWYDILNLADTLSNFRRAIEDPRFTQMVKLIETKSDSEGRFVPESVWKAWEGWDFGQKKVPSAWLTFLVYRIKQRTMM